MMTHQSPLTHAFFTALAGGVANSDKRHTLAALEQHGGMEHEKDAINLSNDYVDHILKLSSQGVGGLMGEKRDASVAPQDLNTAVRDCSMRFNPDDSSNMKYTEYLKTTPDAVQPNDKYDRPVSKLRDRLSV